MLQLRVRQGGCWQPQEGAATPGSPCVPVLREQTVVDSTLPRSLDPTAADGAAAPQGPTHCPRDRRMTATARLASRPPRRASGHTARLFFSEWPVSLTWVLRVLRTLWARVARRGCRGLWPTGSSASVWQTAGCKPGEVQLGSTVLSWVRLLCRVYETLRQARRGGVRSSARDGEASTTCREDRLPAAASAAVSDQPASVCAISALRAWQLTCVSPLAHLVTCGTA